MGMRAEPEAGKRRLLVLVMFILVSTLLVLRFAPDYWIYAIGLAGLTLVLWVTSMTSSERADWWAHMRVLAILVLLLSLASVWLVFEPNASGTERDIQATLWGGIAVAALLVLSWQALSLFREIWRRLKADRSAS